MKTSKQAIPRLTIVATLALPIAAPGHPKPSADHELPLYIDDYDTARDCAHCRLSGS